MATMIKKTPYATFVGIVLAVALDHFQVLNSMCMGVL